MTRCGMPHVWLPERGACTLREGEMVTGLMRRAFRRAATDAPSVQGDAREERSFELVSARCADRDVLVFIDGHGVAVGVEFVADAAAVLTGLAAGVLHSDVEAMRTGDAAVFRLERVTPRAATALIDGMARLSGTRRAELKLALDL